MTPACASLLELKGFGLNCQNLHSMLKISYAGCLGLPPAILAQFTLEVRVAARNHEKFTKIPYFGGRSRSLMLTFLRSSLPVLVTISSMSMCNHFHVRTANNGEITLSKGRCLSFSLSFVGTPFTQWHKFCHKILETLSYPMVKTRSLYLTWAAIGTGL